MLTVGKKPSIQKKNSKSQPPINTFRKSMQTQESQTNLLAEALKTIDTLYQMRFIQKISRPIEKRIKEEYVEKFAGRMESLHNILERIKAESNLYQEQEMEGKDKSGYLSTALQNYPFRKSIRNIESRYGEVFLQGSLKHYKRLYQLNGFTYRLEPINIEEWASVCLNPGQSKKKHCC